MKAGWQRKALGEIAKIGSGNPAPQAKPLFLDGTYPFFRTSDAGRIRFGEIFESTDRLNKKGIDGLRRFPKGTILFPKSGASTFLNHRVMLGVDGFVSSHLATIVADGTQIDPKFLLYFLRTVSAQDLIQDHAYPSLKLTDISAISVSVPPLVEQQRIVGILEEAFDRIGITSANAEKNLRNARALFDSALDLAVQGKFVSRDRNETSVCDLLDQVRELKDRSNRKTRVSKVTMQQFEVATQAPFEVPTNWRWVPLEDLAVGISDGVHKTPKYTTHGIPFVTVKNLTAGSGISFDDVNYISRKDHEEFIKRTHPEKGDILITKDGTIGVVRVIDTDIEFSIFVSVALIKPALRDISRYLAYALRAASIQSQIVPKGAALKHLYLADLRRLAIPLPPLPEQKQIAHKLDLMEAESRCLESIYRQKLDALDVLKESLLHQAFNGAL